MCVRSLCTRSPIDDIYMQFQMGNSTDGDLYNVRPRQMLGAPCFARSRGRVCMRALDPTGGVPAEPDRAGAQHFADRAGGHLQRDLDLPRQLPVRQRSERAWLPGVVPVHRRAGRWRLPLRALPAWLRLSGCRPSHLPDVHARHLQRRHGRTGGIGSGTRVRQHHGVSPHPLLAAWLCAFAWSRGIAAPRRLGTTSASMVRPRRPSAATARRRCPRTPIAPPTARTPRPFRVRPFNK